MKLKAISLFDMEHPNDIENRFKSLPPDLPRVKIYLVNDDFKIRKDEGVIVELWKPGRDKGSWDHLVTLNSDKFDNTINH